MYARTIYIQNVVTGLCVLFTVLLLCMSSANAQHRTWVDEFDDPNLPGWKNLGTHSEWTAVDGSLQVTIAPTPGIELLQFTGLSGPYNHLEASITDVRSQGGFGLALGKACPPARTLRWACYISRGIGVAARVLAGSGYGPFHFCGYSHKYHDRFPDEIDEVESIVVRFDSGTFRVSVNDKVRVEFEDTDFDRLDFIGLAQWGLDDIPAVSHVDSFHFSGVLSVEPGEKLATTWAGLRHD